MEKDNTISRTVQSRLISFTAALFVTSPLLFSQAPFVGGCPVLPADNIWNTPVDTLPVLSASTAYVNKIGSASGLKFDFGAGLWNGGPIGIPYITVPGNQPRYPATFLYYDESDPGPYAVPLNAPIEGGAASTGDRHATSIDVANCILYELYRAFPQTSSWKADSGAIYNLQSNVLRPAGWTSADAAGLPIFPGLVRYDEILVGSINHALRFTVPQTQRAYVWPARHYASSLTDPNYPPMGVRFRLKASFDVSPYAPEVQTILRALKKYGMILADNGSPWYVSGVPDERWNNGNLNGVRNILGSNFEAVDVSSLIVTPDSGQARQTGISVAVSPAAATVTTAQTKQFTATVSGSANTSVTWSVSGVPGGNGGVGYIDGAGLYSAPSSVPNPATVDVSAASQASPSAVGHAGVTIQAPAAVSISISPTSGAVRVNRTLQFTATVSNTADPRVVWKVNGAQGGNSVVGTVTGSGLYQAPAARPSPNTVTVSATSVADPAKTASALVRIRR